MNQVLNSTEVPKPVSQDLYHPTTALSTGTSAGQSGLATGNLEPRTGHLGIIPDEIPLPGLESWEPWGSERLPDSVFD